MLCSTEIDFLGAVSKSEQIEKGPNVQETGKTPSVDSVARLKGKISAV